MGLYLVIAEVKGTPPSGREFIERGKGTMESLVGLQKQGRLHGGGIFSGRMGMCAIIEADGNEDLNDIVIGLPSFATAQWEVIPLHSFERDLEITNRVLAMMGEHGG